MSTAGLVLPGPLLAAGAAPSGHVSLHVLLTYAQTDLSGILADTTLVLAAAAYLVGVRRVSARRHWQATATASFIAGLVVVWLAVGSGLAAYDDLNLTAHVVQHVLLMMVAPLFLVLGRPVTLLSQALPRRAQVVVVRINASWVLTALAGPVGWFLGIAFMAVFFLTPLYTLSLHDKAVHDLCHVAFVVVGYFAWAGAVGLDGPGRRRSPLARIVTSMAAMPFEAALGLALVLWPHPLQPGVSVAETHSAGQVLWMASMLMSGIATVIVIVQWVAADNRRVQREEVLGLAAEAAASGEPSIPA